MPGTTTTRLVSNHDIHQHVAAFVATTATATAANVNIIVIAIAVTVIAVVESMRVLPIRILHPRRLHIILLVVSHKRHHTPSRPHFNHTADPKMLLHRKLLPQRLLLVHEPQPTPRVLNLLRALCTGTIHQRIAGIGRNHSRNHANCR
jgi:hypothetical protein